MQRIVRANNARKKPPNHLSRRAVTGRRSGHPYRTQKVEEASLLLEHSNIRFASCVPCCRKLSFGSCGHPIWQSGGQCLGALVADVVAVEGESFQHPAEKRKKKFITQKEINLPDAEALLKTLIPCTYVPLADSALRAHSHLELEPFPPAHRILNRFLPLIAQIAVSLAVTLQRRGCCPWQQAERRRASEDTLSGGPRCCGAPSSSLCPTKGRPSW